MAKVPRIVPRLADPAERTAALERLEDHLVNISADPSGSDPAAYLSPETLETLAEFERMPAAKRWGRVTEIIHDDITFHWGFRKRNRQTPVQDAEGRPIVGRRVGYLNIGQFETPVLYCSDRKLRMVIKTTGGKQGHVPSEKGRGKRNSKHADKPMYSGYCRLPDPELAMPVRSRGAVYLVSYKHQQSKTLREELGLS